MRRKKSYLINASTKSFPTYAAEQIAQPQGLSSFRSNAMFYFDIVESEERKRGKRRVGEGLPRSAQ